MNSDSSDGPNAATIDTRIPSSQPLNHQPNSSYMCLFDGDVCRPGPILTNSWLFLLIDSAASSCSQGLSSPHTHLLPLWPWVVATARSEVSCVCLSGTKQQRSMHAGMVWSGLVWPLLADAAFARSRSRPNRAGAPSPNPPAVVENQGRFQRAQRPFQTHNFSF